MLRDDAAGIDGVAQLPAYKNLLHGGNPAGDVAPDHSQGDPVAGVDQGALVGQQEEIEDDKFLCGTDGPSPEAGFAAGPQVTDEPPDQPAQFVVGHSHLEQFGVQKNRAPVKEELVKKRVEVALFIDKDIELFLVPDARLQVFADMVDAGIVQLRNQDGAPQKFGVDDPAAHPDEESKERHHQHDGTRDKTGRNEREQ